MEIGDEVLNLARSAGFLMVIGEPRSFSEWGSSYAEYINGVQCLSINPAAPFSESRANCEQLFAAVKRLGDDVIVWRIEPEVYAAPLTGEPRLYFRCHFMSSSDLNRRLDMTPLRAKEAA